MTTVKNLNFTFLGFPQYRNKTFILTIIILLSILYRAKINQSSQKALYIHNWRDTTS